MPLDFFQLLWAALFGYIFFAEVLNSFTLIGGAMIFGSTTYIAWRERHIAQQQKLLK